jgi:hypothetical protein
MPPSPGRPSCRRPRATGRRLFGEGRGELGVERLRRGVDVGLDDARELIALAAARGIRVRHVQGQRILASRDHQDRVRLDVALGPRIDRGDLDGRARRKDLEPDELRGGHRDAPVGPEPDPVLRPDDAAARDRVGRSEVLVAEPDGPGRRLLLDPFPGDREAVGRLDGNVLRHGRHRATLGIGFGRRRVGRDAERDRADGSLFRGDHRRRGRQEDVRPDPADDERQGQDR